ncbi:F0F1 ATP synthase subunit A [Propionibacterium australiense]|uniref:ATP synthase subunit a n=1 Tax=Propionibacterium australiense TaxID=119981 RepID=A0A383S323_9ACTN|nr:F0F1 ATP synthase subunit A [Propionibacterium australiense]RLP11648.1 ATP synthase F0 subunit A [Propionibacterium australiense]RLP12161.1 ATP synthase F0 subunit A [Propionibacterium australiense]SYZ32380.1 ATP synthase A chain [Propionibacterium australiense]VEH90329.1 F-ATPase subunit 6 [Propionibacterium australiense]
MSTAQTTIPGQATKKGSSPALIAVLVIVVWIAATKASQLLTGAASSWESPSTEDFQFEGWFGIWWFNKPLLLALVAFVGILVFWLIASRKLRIVPTKAQFFAEYVYNFVRNIGRDMIGPGYRRFVPYLLTVFCFVLVSNWFGELFLFMFPTFSRVSYAYAAAICTFAAYVVSGFKQHGLGYLKVAMVPSGVPIWLTPVIIPLEFISAFITRPLTLSVRLFANMFAGHMSIMVFVGGGAALLTWAHNAFYNVTGVVALLFGMVMLCLELFIGFLQAYIFTMLTAQYIGSSVGEAH